MKKYFTGFFMAWGMFTVIPCPLKIWDEEARGQMLSCFPLAGLVTGACWALLVMLTRNFPQLLRAVLTAVFPWVLTGFMHLDGYMDVCDAILSRRELSVRQKILKDSHVGAFAVICLAVLTAVSVCTSAEIRIPDGFPAAFLLIPVAVRSAGAIMIMTLKPMETSQYSGRDYDRTLMLLPVVLLIASVVCSVMLAGTLAAPLAALGYFLCALGASRNLAGMNGDISGFALTVGELCGLFALL